MKKIYLILISFSLLFASNIIDSKVKEKMVLNPNNSIFVWIIFKDKGPDTINLKNNPQLYLSQRAIQRRAKFKAPNNIVDYFDYPVYANYISQIKSLGVSIRYKSKWLNSVSAFVTPQQITQISSLPFVKRIDALQQYQTIKKFEPEEITQVAYKVKNNQIDYGASLTQNEIMKVPYAHNIGLSGKGIMIGMFDAGFTNLSHPVFKNMNIAATWDFVNGDADVQDGSDAGSGSHGTATLSCIGGYALGNLIGPAYNATYVLAKTENTESETPLEEDNWIAAIEWADSIGIDIASTSLGYIEYDLPYTSYNWQNMDGKTSKITQVADIAFTRGIIVLNSAGNEGDSDLHNTLGMPADGFNVIAVGAVTKTGARTSFSSVGPSADGRIKPDIMAMGQNVVVASATGTSYYGSSGTSFSCPLAAGATALLLEGNPYINPFVIKDILKTTASNASTPNNKYGWGILNLQKAIDKIKVNIDHIPDNFTIDDSYINIYSNFESYDGKILAYLFYKVNDNTKIDSVKFNKYYGNIYLAQINKENVEKITYYIKAKNYSKFYSFYPKTAPDSFITVNLKLDSIEKINRNRDFILYQNFPNPFNPNTNVKFKIIKPDYYTLKIYSPDGKIVKEYFNDFLLPNTYNINLDFTNFASSNYFLELSNQNTRQIIKLSFIK